MIPFGHKNGPLKIDSKLIHKIPTYFIENQLSWKANVRKNLLNQTTHPAKN
jgi:hypothetical protein